MLKIIRKLKNKSKEDFGDTIWKYDRKKSENSLVLSWFYKLPKKSKILEAGCGIGNYVISLSKIGHEVTGIEIDPKRVNLAKEYMRNYELNPEKIILGDLLRLPFEDNKFDAIFCHGVIEHIKNSEAAVKEMTRVLKKGGFCMISVPNRYTSFTISKLFLQFIDKIFKTKLWSVGYEKSFPQNKFKKMISKHLNIIEFKKKEVVGGTTLPIYGKILRIIDKPLWFSGIGGGWLYSWCQKT